MIRFDLLKADVVNGNGRLYPAELVEAMAKQINTSDVLATLDYSTDGKITADRIVGYARNAEFANGVLTAEVQLTETPMAAIVKTLQESNCTLNLSTSGTGNVDANGVIYDYELTSVFLHTGKNA